VEHGSLGDRSPYNGKWVLQRNGDWGRLLTYHWDNIAMVTFRSHLSLVLVVSPFLSPRHEQIRGSQAPKSVWLLARLPCGTKFVSLV
jgi:hypothetical protein